MRIHKPAFDLNHSESLAIQVLAWLGGEPERLGRFLALTGIDPGDLRRIAGERMFLAAVLEHVTSDPALLEQMAAAQGIDPADVDRARMMLSGGAWERETA